LDAKGAIEDGVRRQRPRLGGRPVAVEISLVGQAAPRQRRSVPRRDRFFLVDMQFVGQYDPKTEGKTVTKTDLPRIFYDDALDLARATDWRSVTELRRARRWLRGKECPAKLVLAATRKGWHLSAVIQPRFLWFQHFHGIGVQPLDDRRRQFPPSRLDRPAVTRITPGKEGPTSISKTRR